MATETKIRRALVTGGNRGIGLAIVRQLLDRGLSVVATARAPDNAPELRALARSTEALALVAMDVTDPDSVRGVAAALEPTGGVDVLVNNAGIAVDQWVPALELELDRWRETMETNLFGVLSCCQAFIPGMQRRGYGRVVNVSSELGSLTNMAMGSTLAYRSSKTALNALTRIVANELADYPDILVNAACPGWVKTPLGGEEAPLSVDEGADTAVWLATLPAGSPTGQLYRERQIYPW